MGRQARQLSSSGFYHVVLRGVNHQHVFEDKSDYTYFQRVLHDLKIDLTFEMHAYGLMSNHVHLLLREKPIGRHIADYEAFTELNMLCSLTANISVAEH